MFGLSKKRKAADPNYLGMRIDNLVLRVGDVDQMRVKMIALEKDNAELQARIDVLEEMNRQMANTITETVNCAGKAAKIAHAAAEKLARMEAVGDLDTLATVKRNLADMQDSNPLCYTGD